MPNRNSQPIVSLLVPVYNVEKYLAECLDSARAQTLSDIEIICIDDGSTDASGAMDRSKSCNASRKKMPAFACSRRRMRDRRPRAMQRSMLHEARS